jgi:protein-disulfide isomerase
MRNTLFFATVLAAVLTVGYFFIPKNESVIAQGKGVDRAEVETIVKDYILKNPEVLIESLNSYQAKMQQEQQGKSSEALKNFSSDIKKLELPFAGNASGDVSVVVFFDYNCGYCKKAFPTIAQLLKEDSKVKVLFVELPILSEASDMASHVALSVHFADKSKYFDYHRKLMEFQGNKTEEQLLTFAAELGLDKAKIKEGMKSEAVNKAIAANKELAQKIGVRGTPAFIVGQQLIPGAVDLPALKSAVEKTRKGEDKAPAKDEKKKEAPVREENAE